MSAAKPSRPSPRRLPATRTAALSQPTYRAMLASLSALLAASRTAAARAVNHLMTATYWQVGRHIVEFEQGGRGRAAYGEQLIPRLSEDLTARFGRGFSARNLETMRLFYLTWQIPQAVSAESGLVPRRSRNPQTTSAGLPVPSPEGPLPAFLLPWSHYVRLLSVADPAARAFYHAESLRGGWSVRQLDRQISTLFFERTQRSSKRDAMLRGASTAGEGLLPEDALKDSFVLEFLGLKDEYSETDLEESLILQLESFLLELGGDFAFVGRQRRLRVGGEWYRVDLLFFHRRLRCLVVIDLKVGKFTHADAGQMHLYLNYAKRHWTQADENPPVGLILCAERDATVARYALEGLPNKVLAAEYRLLLPKEEALAEALADTRKRLEQTRTGRLPAKPRKGKA
jgi:predicted nuclease of restriction endonuclease-like (RecB) superfamily